HLGRENQLQAEPKVETIEQNNS
ncbi:hypothetical protein CCACVL1_00833, partial [Corchorus capsularis]